MGAGKVISWGRQNPWNSSHGRRVYMEPQIVLGVNFIFHDYVNLHPYKHVIQRQKCVVFTLTELNIQQTIQIKCSVIKVLRSFLKPYNF